MNDSTGAILGLSTAVLFVIVYVWYALALSAMFAKTGEPSWKAWVPVVNLATILKLGGFPARPTPHDPLPHLCGDPCVIGVAAAADRVTVCKLV